MSAAAGYSGTPLARKLGIREGMAIALLDAPGALPDLLGVLPDGATVTTRLDGHHPLVVCFLTARAELERQLPALRAAIEPDGMVWVAWPKRASRVPTDVTEDVIRAVVLPTGLVDVKVCAIDATWSGLKLVVRRELR